MGNDENRMPTGLQFGTVSTVRVNKDEPPRVRVRLPLFDNLRTWWLAVLQPKTLVDKFFWMPDIGEHVAVVLDDSGENGVVLGAIYSDADRAPVINADLFHIAFSDGTVIEYDRVSHVLTAQVKGAVNLSAQSLDAQISGAANVTAATISLKGKVKVIGEFEVSGPSKLGDTLSVAGKAKFDSDLVSAGKITDSDGNNGA